MKETQFLGEVLVESPLGNDIIERVMDKYHIYDVRRMKDGLKQRLLHEVDQETDWKAVRQDLEIEIRAVPDLLPPEFASIQKMLDARKLFPAEPTFSEPITEKLKADVVRLYNFTIQLFDFITVNFASQWQTAIDRCFSGMADNLFEYIYSGRVRKIPQDWLSNVQSISMFNDEIVIAMANRMVDQDEIIEKFRKQLNKSFGKRKPKITRKNLPYAQYFGISLREIPNKDIADEYIQQHRRQFPKDEESPEYRTAKRQLEENLKKTVYRLKKTFESMTGEKIS